MVAEIHSMANAWKRGGVTRDRVKAYRRFALNSARNLTAALDELTSIASPWMRMPYLHG
jgi:hypothetical protein